jgi:hypothetical protein
MPKTLITLILLIFEHLDVQGEQDDGSYYMHEDYADLEI